MTDYPLNLFQRTALHWDALAPYNAGQVLRLGIDVAPDRAALAWQQTLSDLSLGKVDLRGRRYRHLPFASPLRILPAGTVLEEFLADQMNLPFELEREGPFRAFLLPEADGPLLGIIYHHWVADSVSIRLLLREWFYRLTGLGTPRTAPFPILKDPSPPGALRKLPGSIAALIDWAIRVKKVRRHPSDVMQDAAVGYRLLRLPDDTAAHLRAAARQRNVKVTDLLLCALALVCHKHMPPTQSRRADLAIGSIRDLRALAHNADEALGVALGFGSILCPSRLLERPPELLPHIAAANQRHRSPAALHAHRLDMRLALLLSHFRGRNPMLEFYRKRMPLSAGLSNLDLTGSWVAPHHPSLIAEFFRVSPTGPTLPLVVTPTTLNRQFNIALTYRTRRFTQEAIGHLANDLVATLNQWLPVPEPPQSAEAPLLTV